MNMTDQLAEKVEVFCVAAGENIFCSRKLIEHAKPSMKHYWNQWLDTRGLPYVGATIGVLPPPETPPQPRAA